MTPEEEDTLRHARRTLRDMEARKEPSLSDLLDALEGDPLMHARLLLADMKRGHGLTHLAASTRGDPEKWFSGGEKSVDPDTVRLLLDKGWIRVTSAREGAFGRTVTVYEITEEGAEL